MSDDSAERTEEATGRRLRKAIEEGDVARSAELPAGGLPLPFRALATDLGAAPILLLDEVAAHLDQDRRAALYDEICALRAQALMTGTEPGLFDSLGARAQRWAVLDEGGVSKVVSEA